jgi:hypothetical protein
MVANQQPPQLTGQSQAHPKDIFVMSTEMVAAPKPRHFMHGSQVYMATIAFR